MKDWTSLVYNLLFSPRLVFAELRTQPQLKWSVSWLVAVLILSPTTWLGCESWGSMAYIAPLILFSLMGNLFFWLMGTAFYHLIAELTGGHGEVRALLSAGALVQVLQLAALPAALLGYLLPAGFSGLWLGIVGLGIAVWMGYLYFLALKVIYSLSAPRAIWVMVSPILLGFLGLILLVIGITFFAVTGPFTNWINL